MCLAIQPYFLCTWAHVPLSPGNEGPGTGHWTHSIIWNEILQKVPATRIMFLPQKEILCKSLGATGRNFLSFEEISCHRQKNPVTGRNFLTQEKIS